jgi:RNA polymerase sigma-70 factor (ECF subfamily)
LESVDKLESWMKSIVVRTSIDHYYKTKNHNLTFIKEEKIENEREVYEPLENVNDEYLISLINSLPDGCRIVFNMFAVEGYSHAEISEMLKISEGTSRSQLHHAKFLLKEKLKCQNMAHYYEKFA